MQDSTIIWNFLTREYSDEHPVIYLYACGQVRSKTTAIQKVMELVKPIFYPAMDEVLLKTVVTAFFEFKRKQYMKGEIKVKPLY